MLRTVSLVWSRFVEVTLVALGVWLFLKFELLPLVLWDLLAVVYLAMRIVRVTRSKRHTGDQAEWLRMLVGRRSGLMFTLFTSLVGLTAGVVIAFNDQLSLLAPGADPGVAKGLAVPAVLFAWAILHFGYAERYAQAYYAALPHRILDFPGTPQPVFMDFAYFSFTVGTSFAVSDVETTSSVARGKILAHGVLAFFYNTAILAVAIGVVTGG